MSHIDLIKDCGGIIGIHVTDELGFHFEFAVLLCPAFQCQIHGTGAKVGTADQVYVRVDENKAYWVRGEETGSVDLW